MDAASSATDAAVEACVPDVPGFGDPNEPPWYMPSFDWSPANPANFCGPCGRVPPHRVGDEYIHALGFFSDGESGAIVTQGDYVYWTQAHGQVFLRGRKDGEGRPEVIGELSQHIAGSGILIDEDHIYWMDHTVLQATKLDTLEMRQTDTGVSVYYGAFAQDQDHIYLATPECETILQLSKSELEVTQTYQLEVPEGGAGSGGTALAIDDTSLYCASHARTYVQPKAGGEPLLLDLEPEVRRVAVFGDTGQRMYWRTTEVGNEFSNLAYFDKRTQAVVSVGQTPGAGGGSMTFDAVRNRLYWNTISKVVSYNVETEQFGVLAWFRNTYRGTADSDYIYFGERVYGEPCNPTTTQIGVITRFPKDTPAEPWPWVHPDDR